jgi:multicomponent Na+:H+ antiporter subunit D
MFFGRDRGLRATEAPRNMLAAMGIAAIACIVIGVAPVVLYSRLPFRVDYIPYTLRHVTATLGLLGFTALGFFLLLKQLDPEPVISLDTDWFYRRGGVAVQNFAQGALVRLEGSVAQISDVVMQRFVLGVAARLRDIDLRGVDAMMEGIGRLTEEISRDLTLASTGHVQRYALVMAAGVLAGVALAVFAW